MPTAQIPLYSNQAVRLSTRSGILLREDSAFTNSRGVEERSLRKRSEKVLDTLQEPLRRMLEPEEAVLYIARGQIMPGKPERYMLGVQSHYLAPAVLILTNRRLLHLSLQLNGRWNRNMRSARWGDVKRGDVTGFLYGKLHIEYRCGSKEIYWRIRKDAAKKIQLLLDVLLPASRGETSEALAMASFCPACLAALTPGVYECHRCRLKFKNEKTALLHALLIPGGGYFYTGFGLWGVAHALIDVSALLSAIFWALAAMGRVQPQPLPGVPPGKFAYSLVAGILATALALDIWLAIRVARNAIRNFIPDS